MPAKGVDCTSSERLLKSYDVAAASPINGDSTSNKGHNMFYNSMPPNYGTISSVSKVGGDIRIPVLTVANTTKPKRLERVGMSRSELRKYETDPFWIRLRTTLHVLFWCAWFSMAIGSVLVVMAAPRCALPPPLAWWQKATVYQIYVDSFMDSDGDGRGDIKGLASKLDYLEELGVDTLLLSRIHPAPLPITNDADLEIYMDIDQHVGSMEEFELFLNDVENRGLKVVLDLEFASSNIEEIPSSQSSISELPEEIENETLQYTVLLFKPPEDEHLIADFENLETTTVSAPENSSREAIEEKLLEILGFWLDKGVAGFRLVVQEGDSNLPSAATTVIQTPNPRQDGNGCSELLQQETEPESTLVRWQALLKEYSNKTGMDRVLLTGACGNIITPASYSNTPFNFDFLRLNRNMTVKDLHKILASPDLQHPELWPNWVLGDYITPRLTTRVGSELLDGIHMAVLLARGTPVIFYGDEIGMEDTQNNTNSSLSSISPMQWNDEVMAGFTEANSSWLPVNKNYKEVNVEVEKANENSHLNVFRNLVRLRQKQTIKRGIQEFPLVTDSVFSMLRVFKGEPGYLVVLNWSDKIVKTSFKGTSKYLPDVAEVEVHSDSTTENGINNLDAKRVSLENLVLGPKEAAVLIFSPSWA